MSFGKKSIERGGKHEIEKLVRDVSMNSITPMLRFFPAAGIAAVLILSGCTRKPAPQPDASVDASVTPAAAGETTPTAEAVSPRSALPETAPFFSERFLPPAQRLERRQSRILEVLETTPTESAAQES